ncbi:MAG: hypothetical protein GXX85_05095 [Ignavibacteria bacterium]|nr:hypothetical protein [Ignavibacteria bacterium]
MEKKYSSDHIVALFKKEREYRLFQFFLVASLLSLLVWTLEFDPLLQIDGLNYLINNSAAIIIIFLSIALVIFFFIFVEKVLCYYTPSSLINYLIKQHHKDKKDFIFFRALSDIFLKSIKKQDKNSLETLSNFFYYEFKRERENSKDRPVEYPDVFYDLVNKSVEELAASTNAKRLGIEYLTAGGIFLLGEADEVQISEKTFSWLWDNLNAILKYKRDDFILDYWETAHQYFSCQLSKIHAEEEDSNYEQPTNSELIVERETQRKRFLEFHYALGGLLLSQKRFVCLKSIFEYTTNHPPKYELIPETMSEVLVIFYRYWDTYSRRYPQITGRYYFPGQRGINEDIVVNKWISYYSALLFIRQFKLYKYINDPLAFPSIPTNQREIKRWIDLLPYFRKLVEELLKDNELLHAIGFDVLTEEWCSNNNKPYPLSFIDMFNEQLINAYTDGENKITLDEKKKDQFKNSTKEIIEKRLKNLEAIKNQAEINKDYSSYIVHGRTMRQRKEIFSSTPETDVDNFDTYLAERLSKDILENVVLTFHINSTKTYLFKPVDLFDAINKLKLKWKDDLVVICFGISIEKYIKTYKIEGLKKNNYNGSKIYSFDKPVNEVPLLFILKASDLPALNVNVIDKYKLDKVSDDFGIYASVIDLNDEDEIRKENVSDNATDDELRKYALLSIILQLEIKWKKGIEMIKIFEYSEYRDKGFPNELSDIL